VRSTTVWIPDGDRGVGRLTGSAAPPTLVPVTTRTPHTILAALLVAIVAVTACGGNAPAGPVLTDPTAIITAALTSTEAATSVHADVAVDGVVPVTLPGSSGSTEVDLTGTTANADIDLGAAEMRATFSVPAVLGLAGELIQADGTTYLKTTLTGSKFKVVDELTTFAVDPTDMSGLVDNLGDFLLKPGVDPVKGDDVACGGTQCYTVVVDLDADELAALLGDGATGLPVDVAGSTLQLTIRVEQTLPNHLAGISLTLGLPSGEPLTVDATFSKWDQPVTIEAPTADEIAS
jgi:hypothetical protein